MVFYLIDCKLVAARLLKNATVAGVVYCSTFTVRVGRVCLLFGMAKGSPREVLGDVFVFFIGWLFTCLLGYPSVVLRLEARGKRDCQVPTSNNNSSCCRFPLLPSPWWIDLNQARTKRPAEVEGEGVWGRINLVVVVWRWYFLTMSVVTFVCYCCSIKMGFIIGDSPPY